MGGYKVTEERFLKAKELCENTDWKDNRIAKFCQMSNTTVGRIRSSESYDEYWTGQKKARTLDELEAMDKPKQAVVIQPPELLATKKDIENLKSWFVEILAEASEGKKGWFRR